MGRRRGCAAGHGRSCYLCCDNQHDYHHYRAAHDGTTNNSSPAYDRPDGHGGAGTNYDRCAGTDYGAHNQELSSMSAESTARD